MELPTLNLRPGRVVESKIIRRFGTPVTLDPSSSFSAFYLVLPVRRCIFRLSPATMGCLL
jgi:hypothetical protein